MECYAFKNSQVILLNKSQSNKICNKTLSRSNAELCPKWPGIHRLCSGDPTVSQLQKLEHNYLIIN